MKALWIVAGLVALQLVVGCSDRGNSDKTVSPVVPASVTGTWQFENASVDSYPLSLSYLFGWQATTATARLMIDDDGGAIYEEYDSLAAVLIADTASFTVDGNHFAVTGDILPVGGGTWNIVGDRLTLTADVQSHRVIVSAVRKS